MPLCDYIHSKLIVFSDAQTRDEVLNQLVDHIYINFHLNNKDLFLQAIKDRENILSTGIGTGIAIPHAKLATCDQFFIAIGILKNEVEWNALDKAPVRLVFMIGGPDNQQTEYLQLLSALTKFLKHEERRHLLLSLKDPQAIVELFYSI